MSLCQSLPVCCPQGILRLPPRSHHHHIWQSLTTCKENFSRLWTHSRIVPWKMSKPNFTEFCQIVFFSTNAALTWHMRITWCTHSPQALGRPSIGTLAGVAWFWRDQLWWWPPDSVCSDFWQHLSWCVSLHGHTWDLFSDVQLKCVFTFLLDLKLFFIC